MILLHAEVWKPLPYMFRFLISDFHLTTKPNFYPLKLADLSWSEDGGSKFEFAEDLGYVILRGPALFSACGSSWPKDNYF